MGKLLLATGCLLLAVGCTQTSSQTSGKPVVANVQNIKPQAVGVVARHGHLPIEYAIQGTHRVRVMDVTTGKKVWEHRVENNTQLRVAADGIQVNSLHVYKGKLKKGHVYEIVLIRQ